MPRKIANTNELTDNAAAMADHRCELCGAQLTGPGEYSTTCGTHADHDATEALRRIALFMADDWKACCTLLLFIASPSAPLSWISKKLGVSVAGCHSARNRAAENFPELAPILGKKTRAALAQQQRFEKQKPQTEQPALFS